MQWKKTCLQSAYKADKSLQRKHSLKYLGITFDKLPYLISMSQIQLMEQKKKRLTAVKTMTAAQMPKHTLLILCKALVLSVMDESFGFHILYLLQASKILSHKEWGYEVHTWMQPRHIIWSHAMQSRTAFNTRLPQNCPSEIPLSRRSLSDYPFSPKIWANNPLKTQKRNCMSESSKQDNWDLHLNTKRQERWRLDRYRRSWAPHPSHLHNWPWM